MKILLTQNAGYFLSTVGSFKANRILMRGLAERGHQCAAVTREDFGELQKRGVRVNANDETVTLRHEGVEVHGAQNRYRQAIILAEVMRTFQPDVTIVSEEGSLLL